MKNKNYLKPFVGYVVVDTQKCDLCPNEPTDCKKLILAGDEHLCVKPNN